MRSDAFNHGDADAKIGEIAARWLARRDRGLSTEEWDELQRWQEADPRHAAELAVLETSWARLDLAKVDTALAAEAAALDRDTASRMKRRLQWRPWSLAAAAALVVAGGIAWQHGFDSAKVDSTYQVVESSARRIELSDGSVAEVRDDSEVRSEFTLAERRIRLVRGEAHFKVMPDASRPFVVVAGDTAVRAVGTAFNVRLDAAEVEVLVTEGKVRVADSNRPAVGADEPAPLVVAGQRAVVTREPAASAGPNVAVSSAAPAEVEQALGWQSKRLVFDRTPLNEAVDAFNQHAAAGGIRVVLGEPSLRSRRLGGTFRAANAEGFVRLLEQSVEVRSERQGDQVILYPVK